MALREKASIYEPTNETPMDRLRETWSNVLRRRGWEYGLLKETIGMGVFTGFTFGYFIRNKENKEVVVKQLIAEKVQEPEFTVRMRKMLTRANLNSTLRYGWRYAIIPISLGSIALSTLSYRNHIYPLDFAVAYGAFGGLLYADRGFKKAAKASAICANAGLLTAAFIWYILYCKDVTVRDLRLHFAAEYNYGVEYKNRMAMLNEKKSPHARMLQEREKLRLDEQRARSE